MNSSRYLETKNYLRKKLQKVRSVRLVKKLNYTAFIELNRECVNHFYVNSNYLLWNGFRLVAYDGTRINIPKNPETIQYFGEQKTSEKAEGYIIAIGC